MNGSDSLSSFQHRLHESVECEGGRLIARARSERDSASAAAALGGVLAKEGEARVRSFLIVIAND